MRLWIGVYLSLLPLEAHRPRWSEPGTHVVIESERVLVASMDALDAGVRVGMKRGGVLAICPDAVLYERDEKREHTALNSVALCLLQYTPEVASTSRVACRDRLPHAWRLAQATARWPATTLLRHGVE